MKRLVFFPASLARLGVLLLGLSLVAGPAFAQQEEPAPVEEEASNRNPYGTGMGLEVLVTNSGFGLGGYYLKALGRATSFMVETSIGAGKSDREIQFFGIGRSYIPTKANYLLMMPLQAGVLRRLFQSDIEDDFRPYLQFTTGPTLGWEYPYFDDLDGNGSFDPDVFLDENGNGVRDDGEPQERTFDSIGAIPKGSFRGGLGGTLAIGAHFGLSRKVTQGVRIGYTFTYFFEAIQLLEPEVKQAQHYFGSPSISLTFGRLF